MSAWVCGCDPEADHQCEELDCICRRYNTAILMESLSQRAVDQVAAMYRVMPKGLRTQTGARASTLPADPLERKQYPVASGVLDYFPDAIVALSHLSYVGNEQHNPGTPLHWDRSKSADETDTMLRHYLQRGSTDTDGVSHTVKMAWRALAILQKEIEECL